MEKVVFIFLISLLIISCKKNDSTEKTIDISSKNEIFSEQKNERNQKELITQNPLWYERSAVYNKNDFSISKEKLTSAIWRMDPDYNQYALLVFDENNEFKIGTLQAGVFLRGNYRIENNQIILFDYIIDSRRGIDFTINGEEYTASINFDSINYLYKHELVIEGISFFPVGSEKDPGESALINGEKVIVVRNNYVFNDTVKFRAKPTLKSDLIKVIRYSELEYNRRLPDIHYFVKGTIVEVLAKKTEAETIDGVSASWCYIKVFDGFEGYQYGWVFGAYFNEYDKTKKGEYNEIMWNEIKTKLGIQKEIEQP